MVSREFDWEGVRLHVVTGKGGTGKTTVAAALALALAGDGRRVLLVEVEGRQGIAQLFDSPPLPYEERKVAVGPGGGDVYALAIDPEEALLEYLEMFYKLVAPGAALRKIGAIDFATTIAPGPARRAADRQGQRGGTPPAGRRSTDRVYDAVVLDAPPTGRITRFLNVNAEVAGLAKVGPIRGQADSSWRLLTSPQTAVHFVTLLEEMPVQETVDAVAELHRGRPAGRRRSSSTWCASRCCGAADLHRGDQGPADPRRGRRRPEGGRGRRPGQRRRRPAGRGRRARRAGGAGEGGAARPLKALGRPTYELPLLSEGVDLGGLYQLAERLCAQGAA